MDIENRDDIHEAIQQLYFGRKDAGSRPIDIKIQQFRADAVRAGTTRALALGLARVETELVVRAALPATDFGAATEQYAGPAIAAAGWGPVFSTAFAPTLANSKVAVFYKFANYGVRPQMIGVRFRVGRTGATTKASFFTQLDGVKLEPDVYFSKPVVYDPQDVVYIEAYYQAAVAAGAEQFAFGCFIVERRGARHE